MLVKIIQSRVNTGKIIVENPEYIRQIRDNFSVLERNFGYYKYCKMRNIAMRPEKEYTQKSCITPSGEFELGMLFEIVGFCQKQFYEVRLQFELDENIQAYISSNDLKLISDVIVNAEGAKPRNYQIDSMQQALNNEKGLYILGTGAGKTLCTALLARNILKHKLSKRILIICPFPDLANQTAKELEYSLSKHKYVVSKWFGSNKLDKKSHIIVAGSDIVRSQYKDVKTFIDKIDCLIVDEVHQLKASNKISDIIAQIPAKYRYGFTGTLPTDLVDRWSIIGKIGPVRYELPSAELREGKFLTPVKASCFHLHVENKPDYMEYPAEVEFLSANEEFNNRIASFAANLKNNSLVLINRLQHGEQLVERLKIAAPDKQIVFIRGEVELSERSKIRAIMEESDNVIAVAQVSIFSTGVNVKNIHNIVFPGLIGKSSVRVIQSIGRILRLHENKEVATIIDIVPDTYYSLKHFEERKTIYTQEKIPFSEFEL